MAGIANISLTLILTLLFTQAHANSFSTTNLMARSAVQTGDVFVMGKALSFRQRFPELEAASCYEGLGCFSMDYPWTSVLRPLPAPHSPTSIKVQLYCYTRLDPNRRYTVILWPKIRLNSCPIRADRKLVLITHGFLNNGNSSWMSDIKDNYLIEEDATVCLVDWGKGAERLNYLQAASNTRIVGAEIARFLMFVDKEFGVKAEYVHLIGHSLGAQISAYAAKRVPGIDRLSALDPAQPAFEGCDRAVRLDKSDATFVEVVHTNAAAFLPTLGFGMMEPVGDVDFYMNGGIKQPGCKRPKLGSVMSIFDLGKIPVEVLSMWVACSHGRAYEYFAQVLQKNCTIWGRLADVSIRLLRTGSMLGLMEPEVTSQVDVCDEDTCIPMGLETPRYKARGAFIATTSATPPFCSPPEENSKIRNEIFKSYKLFPLCAYVLMPKINRYFKTWTLSTYVSISISTN